MKVNVEIDLSPAEARELMGWQDLSQLHERFLKLAAEQMQNGDPTTINALMQPFLSEAQKSFGLYQKMMESFVAGNGNAKTKPDK
jgi:hypothetical protein